MTVVVAPTTARPGQCRHCRARILWVTTMSQPGRPAKTLPFDAPKPYALSTQRNATTGIVFETWPRAALHFATCPNQPRPARAATSTASARRTVDAAPAEPTLFDALHGEVR